MGPIQSGHGEIICEILGGGWELVADGNNFDKNSVEFVLYHSPEIGTM